MKSAQIRQSERGRRGWVTAVSIQTKLVFPPKTNNNRYKLPPLLPSSSQPPNLPTSHLPTSPPPHLPTCSPPHLPTSPPTVSDDSTRLLEPDLGNAKDGLLHALTNCQYGLLGPSSSTPLPPLRALLDSIERTGEGKEVGEESQGVMKEGATVEGVETSYTGEVKNL